MTASVFLRRAAVCLGLAGLLLAPSVALALTCEGTPGETKLILEIEGARSAKGLMTATLYPGDKSQFLAKNGALKVWSEPARTPTTRMCIWLKAPGTYAVAAYHDANSNHKLDISLFGYSELVGFSNNPRIMLSKPSYESVRFQAKAGETTLHIRLTPGK